MNNFLNRSKKLISLSETICIVLGNESCDLDSTVCSLSLAYYYSLFPEKNPSIEKFNHCIPLINIPKNEFPLKTEVVYYLKKNNIDESNLIFKDELETSIIKKSKLILVDHHVTSNPELVVAVFDHRPFDPSSNLSTDCSKLIDPVGSCATLIANQYLQNYNDLDKSSCDINEPLKLLYGAIILDTVNFSKEADRARELDFTIAEKIEDILCVTDYEEHRRNIFNDLVQARTNISSLNSLQILYKDLKIIANKIGSKTVALPGYPILTQDYIKMNSVEDNIKTFVSKHNCSVILLIGMKVTGGNVERDLGLINISDKNIFDDICEKLLGHKDPCLQLEEYAECNFMEGRFFKQNNIKASRKQILPIVKNVLDA